MRTVRSGLGLAFAAAVLILGLSARAALAQNPYACAGVEHAPVDLVVVDDGAPLVPSSSHVLHARLYALDVVDSLRVDLSAFGPVTLTGPLTFDFGSLADGDSVDFSIPVDYGVEGISTVHFDVTMALSVEPANVADYDFYTLVRTPPYHGAGSMDGAEMVAFYGEEADSASGAITPAQSDSLEEAFLDTPDDETADSSATAPHLIAPSRALPDGRLAAANVTVIGKFYWKDSANNPHPVAIGRVELWDAETVGADRLLASTLTDENGVASFTVPNDDGFLGGGIDAYLKIFTSNPYVYFHAYKQGRYFGKTSRIDNLRDNWTYTFNATLKNDHEQGCSWSPFQALTQTSLYAKQLNGGTALASLDTEWPMFTGKRDDGSKLETSQFDGGSHAYILRPDRWDWDVCMHEYGHYVQSKFELSNSPGGKHSQPCLSVQRGSKDKGVRLAWGEGWATYYGLVGQAVRNIAALGIPKAGDRFYDDTEDSKIHDDLEAQDNTDIGEDSELSVSRVFWDLYDTPSDLYETTQKSDQALFDLIKAPKAKTLSSAWAAVRASAANAGQDLALAGVVCNHQVAPVPAAPADGALVAPGTTFSWPRAVGCSANRGNQFDMVFFKPGTPPVRLAVIPTMANLANPTHDLTLAEYETLLPQVDANEQLLWAVEARNTSAPATGSYMGIARTVKLDGAVATLLALRTVEPSPDHVALTWEGAGANAVMASATVERRSESSDWQALGSPALAADDQLTFDDRAVTPNTRYAYRLAYVDGGVSRTTPEAWVTVPATLALALEGFRPNPAGTRPGIAFTLPGPGRASIEILDVAGRRVFARDVGAQGAGRHVLGVDARIAPGLYLVRLRQGSRVLTARGIVIL